MKKKYDQITHFLKIGIWRIRLKEMSGSRSFWIRQLRILLLAIRAFDENKCQLRASALTFYTILSIVPMVALAFGIAQGFGVEPLLEKQLYSNLYAQEEVVRMIIEFAQTLLKTSKGGLIAGVGIILLFWTIIKVLTHIEEAFNDIWGVKKGRSLGRKFADYLAIMLICPVLFVLSSSLTILLSAKIELINQKLIEMGMYHPFLHTLLKIAPSAILWLLFSFVYIFMPNTKVKLKSGLVAGVISGPMYQMLQWVYLDFQMAVTSYGPVYGSFAALPLFLIWLQTGWMIILFGAEISFAVQNVETYEFEPDCLKVSLSFKRLVALRIAQLSVKLFVDSKLPLSANEMARQLGLPIRLVNEVVYNLTEAGILSEVKGSDAKSFAYQPAKNIESLTIVSVLEALDHQGIEDVPLYESRELKTIDKSLGHFKKQLEQSSGNVLLKEI